MRMSLPVANLCLIAAVVLSLAACRREAPQEATPPGDAAAATDAAAAPGAAAPAGNPALQGDVIASTNEPFWQASVIGNALLLRGIGSERSLAVTASDIAGDTRTIRASDPNGVVELQVIAAPCQDTMAGAHFPLSAVLAIDGGTPVKGCARPASMPPPGEPQ
jgi:uncharacterized membrane protein